MRSLLAVLLVAVTACSADPAPPAAKASPALTPKVASELSAPATTPPTTENAIESGPLPAATTVVEISSATVAASSAEASSQGSPTPVLTAVRTGNQPGADRLVFEFDGVGLPAWKIDYVDRPVRDCGTGDPVEVAGDAWLQVRFSGAQAHSEAGVGTSGPRRRAVEQTVLRELVRLCDFEGEVTWVAGLARPNAYTARVLKSPSRLVIDIAH